MESRRRSYPTRPTDASTVNPNRASMNAADTSCQPVVAGSNTSDSQRFINMTDGVKSSQVTRGRAVRNTTTNDTTKQRTKTKAIKSTTDDHHLQQVVAENRNNGSRLAHVQVSNYQSSSKRAPPQLRAQFSTGQTNIGPTSSSRDARNESIPTKTPRNGPERKTVPKRNMGSKVPGFDGGPTMAVSGKSNRRQSQMEETNGVPIAVPRKGTRPTPVESGTGHRRMPGVVSKGRNGEHDQPIQLSRSSSADTRVHHLCWGEHKPKPKPKDVVKLTRTKFTVDVDAWDAEKQKKAAALKKITFSKKVKEVKEEVREEEGLWSLHVGEPEADGARVGGTEKSGEYESGEVNTDGVVNGAKVEERRVLDEALPPRREHSLWTWEGQDNIPGLSAATTRASSSALITHAEDAGQASVDSSRTETVRPPPDIVLDLSDYEDLYLSKEAAKVSVADAGSGAGGHVQEQQIQVKEEREDEDNFMLQLPFPCHQPIPFTNVDAGATSGLSGAGTAETTLYQLDSGGTINPKNKRKQNFAQAKRRKADAVAVQSEVGREVSRVQDGGGEGEGQVSRPIPTGPRKRGRPPKTMKGKEKEKNMGANEELLGGVFLSTPPVVIPIVSPSGVGESIARKDDESAQNGAIVELKKEGVEGGIGAPLTSTISTLDATGVLPSPQVTKRGRKRKQKGQATEGEEKSLDPGANPAGGEDIPHPDETPRKKRRVRKDQADGGEKGQIPGVNFAGDVDILNQDEPPSKRRKAKSRVTEAGESNQVRGEDLPRSDETSRKKRREKNHADGGEKGILHQDETPSKREKAKSRTTEGGENDQIPGADSAERNEILHLNETPGKKRKGNSRAIEGEEGEGPSVDLIEGKEVVPHSDETPRKKRKVKDQNPTEAAPEAPKKRGRPPKKKDDVIGAEADRETKMVEVKKSGALKEVNEKTRGRKKRASMDGKTDSVVVRKRRVKFGREGGEEGDGARRSGKAVKSLVKWMMVCQRRNAAGKKAARQAKGKEKAQLTPTYGVEDKYKEENQLRKTLRPSIWAGSKTELLLVLPELSGTRCFNGITEGSSNFPMVMLDESTDEGISIDVRWMESSQGTASVRLALTRDFVCPVSELANAIEVPMDSVSSLKMDSSADVVIEPKPPPTAGPPPCSDAIGSGVMIDDFPPSVPPLHDDVDLEYIDEDMPQEKVIISFTFPSVEMSAAPLIAGSPHVLPVAQEAVTTTAHTLQQVQSMLQTPVPVIHISQHDSAPSTPCTIPTHSLQNQLFPFEQDDIPLLDLEFTAPLSAPQMPINGDIPSPTSPFMHSSALDTIIPNSLPPEIEILSSSWRLSLPLILISSYETFNQHFWAPPKPPTSQSPHDNPGSVKRIGLAEEHAYVFLGFFRIVKMGERRVTLSDEEKNKVNPGQITGRVEWTFDIDWVPGYDGSKSSEEFSRPWWAPDFVFGRPGEGVNTNGSEGGGRKEFTWLEKHAQARLNLLPTQLVDGQEDGSSDEAMPKGWLCKTCGKLNQKVMMRHRWCGSTVCRDNPLSEGYAVDLFSARDPNQTPLALPISTCDQKTVDVRVVDWDDGMRTLKYRPMPMQYQNGTGGVLKHVFTCNIGALQTEATPLFESIQSKVCLMKNTGDSGPFFKCHVSGSRTNKRDKHAFSSLTWDDAPQPVWDVQNLMTFIGKIYGEDETLDIDQLTIVGWVSSGTRKTPECLAAKKRTISMLCLGNDVVLTIVPKWEVPAAVVPVPGPVQLQLQVVPNMAVYPPSYAPDVEMVSSIALPQIQNEMWINVPVGVPILPEPFIPMEIQSALARTPRAIRPTSTIEMQDDVDIRSATNQMRSISDQSVDPRKGRSKPMSKSKSKQPTEAMSVTLVHGDMLLFSGCDFEYSIKRMGTCILVIGTKGDFSAGTQDD